MEDKIVLAMDWQGNLCWSWVNDPEWIFAWLRLIYDSEAQFLDVHNQKHFSFSVFGHTLELHNNVGHVSHLRQSVVISRDLLNF